MAAEFVPVPPPGRLQTSVPRQKRAERLRPRMSHDVPGAPTSSGPRSAPGAGLDGGKKIKRRTAFKAFWPEKGRAPPPSSPARPRTSPSQLDFRTKHTSCRHLLFLVSDTVSGDAAELRTQSTSSLPSLKKLHPCSKQILECQG